MIKLEYDKESLWQWDLNQRIVLTNIDKNIEVHFSDTYNTQEDCPVLKTYEENGQIYADIPNIYLQKSGFIQVYIYVKESDSCYTEHHAEILVLPRPKPADYIYTETERYMVEDVVKELVKIPVYVRDNKTISVKDKVYNSFVELAKDASVEISALYACYNFYYENAFSDLNGESPDNRTYVEFVPLCFARWGTTTGLDEGVTLEGKGHCYALNEEGNSELCECVIVIDQRNYEEKFHIVKRVLNDYTNTEIDAKLEEVLELAKKMDVNPCGVWSSTVAYYKRDLVTHENGIYLAMKYSKNTKPNSTSVANGFWMRIFEVDASLFNYVSKSSANNVVYARYDNREVALEFSSGLASPYTIVRRDSKGGIIAADPTRSDECATKNYVDKLYQKIRDDLGI